MKGWWLHENSSCMPLSPTLQATSKGLDKPKKFEKKLTPCQQPSSWPRSPFPRSLLLVGLLWRITIYSFLLFPLTKHPFSLVEQGSWGDLALSHMPLFLQQTSPGLCSWRRQRRKTTSEYASLLEVEAQNFLTTTSALSVGRSKSHGVEEFILTFMRGAPESQGRVHGGRRDKGVKHWTIHTIHHKFYSDMSKTGIVLMSWQWDYRWFFLSSLCLYFIISFYIFKL